MFYNPAPDKGAPSITFVVQVRQHKRKYTDLLIRGWKNSLSSPLYPLVAFSAPDNLSVVGATLW